MRLWCYTCRVPTTRPRYMITDTGATAAMLDLAQQRWPDIADRKELLLRLAAAGRDAIAPDVETRRAREPPAAATRGDLARPGSWTSRRC